MNGMTSVTRQELQEAIQQLDQAIYNHEQWYQLLSRTLICHLPYDQHDVQDNAHTQCRFGQWYYGQVPEPLRKHPGFVAIGVEHENMHRLVASLLRTDDGGEPIPLSKYNDFANSLERMRLQIQTLRRELEMALHTLDPLTGADGRVGLLTRLRELQELVKRRVEACCVVMMDIDHFKQVNDSYGHLAGDQVLAVSARYVMERIRPYDKLFRYGGEEFVICMQNADADVGFAVVERLREGLAANPVEIEGQSPIHVTASFGLATLEADITVEQSIERADKAMYAAKAAGRNCTRVWDASM